jgi:predicted nucleotidyltransferase component of viral defense system
MLHLQTVESDTFALLEGLLSIEAFENYALVGGTALSLLYGHRISVDIDLFSNTPLNNEEIISVLAKKFKDKFEVRTKNPRFGVFCFINDVKVDIVNNPHVYLKPFISHGSIRMYSTEDIVAMKVQAVLGRGKKKDFWDISELLNHYSVERFIEFHNQKYPNQNLLIAIPHALTYFSDADESEDPISLKGQTWESVQSSIQKKVREYLQA